MKEAEQETAVPGADRFKLLKPAGLLFDLDGVLIDSRQSWHAALAAVFQEHLQRELREEEFMARYWARDLREIFQELGLNLELDSFCRQDYPEFIDRVTLFPKTIEILEILADYPKVIITNTPPGCTREITNRFDLARFFQAVVTGFEVERSKPAPDIVLRGCSILGIRPEEAVVIGDSTLDVRAGRAAGALVVGVGVAADYTVTDLAGLLDLFDTGPAA